MYYRNPKVWVIGRRLLRKSYNKVKQKLFAEVSRKEDLHDWYSWQIKLEPYS